MFIPTWTCFPNLQKRPLSLVVVLKRIQYLPFFLNRTILDHIARQCHLDYAAAVRPYSNTKRLGIFFQMSQWRIHIRMTVRQLVRSIDFQSRVLAVPYITQLIVAEQQLDAGQFSIKLS